MLVSIKFLKPGMELSNDVVTKEGNLLIPCGIILNEYHISKLVEFGIGRVDISGEGVYDEYSLDFDVNYKKAIERLNAIFNYAKFKNTVNMSECFEIVDSLISNSKMGRNLISHMKTTNREYDYFLQHSVNVCILSLLMGTWMGYDEDSMRILGVSALLHDIGRVKISDDIVNKPGKLTPDEYVIVKNHTRHGFQILKDVNVSDEVIRSAALAHHERMDGKGYPFSLQGTVLNEKVRIISICDVYDAITSTDPIKENKTHSKVLKSSMITALKVWTHICARCL
jgi:putative nucleotidyltransferase with HDIG domain